MCKLYIFSADKVSILTVFIVGTVLFVFIMVIAVKWRHLFKEHGEVTVYYIFALKTILFYMLRFQRIQICCHIIVHNNNILYKATSMIK